MQDLSEVIGARLRALRESHQLTQVEMSERIGIDQSSLAKKEAGAGLSALDRLAEKLRSGGFDPTVLLREGEAEKADPVATRIGRLDPTSRDLLLRLLDHLEHQHVVSDALETAQRLARLPPSVRLGIEQAIKGFTASSVRSAPGIE